MPAGFFFPYTQNWVDLANKYCYISTLVYIENVLEHNNSHILFINTKVLRATTGIQDVSPFISHLTTQNLSY